MSIERDIDAELHFHFDARIEELVRQGLSPDAARAKAVEEFGDVEAVRAGLTAIDRRVVRRRNRLEIFDTLWQDVRYAARSLSRTPAVSLTIIATLALGLGVNAAMFSLLDVIFLREPAGVAQPGDLRRVWADRRFRDGTQFWSGYDYSQFSAVQQSLKSQADLALYRAPELRRLGRGENAPRVGVSAVSATYFSLLGVKPQLGRFFDDDENRLDVPASVVIISDAFWKRDFSDLATPVGQQISLSNERFTIIGVAPPSFSGVDLDAADVWMPLATSVGGRSTGSNLPWWKDQRVNGFQILLRLHPGAREGELVSRTTATLRNPIAGPRADSSTVAEFGSIVFARGPGKLKTEMFVAIRLAGVAIVVLLIACANVINLLLARALRRRREIAVRIALGVSRARLIRMLVTESVLLAVVAMLAAIAAAVWGGGLLRRLLMPEVHFAHSPMHWRVFLFALAAAVVAGALAGLVPALQSASPDLTNSLKAGSREGGGHRSRLRNALVTMQAALSVVLLVGAVLFVRSLHNVKARDVGFTVDQLAFASIRYDVPDPIRDKEIPGRLKALEARFASIPGVNRVAFASTYPKFSFSFVSYVPDVDTTGKRLPDGIFTAVSPGYFDAMGMRLLRGTTFPSNVTDASPYSVIVNQAMADAIWPNQDPIGHCIRFADRRAKPGQPIPCSTVIAVVQTALFTNIKEEPQPQFYVSAEHSPTSTWGGSTIIVRASPSQMTTVQRSLTTLLRTEFPGAIPNWKTMAAVMEPEYRPWQLGATLFTLFGVLALCVAGIGIYSSVSYAVGQRTHEFGVRIALGARMADVIKQVLGEGLRTVALGLVLGVLLALAAGRLVASLLYGIAPSDPLALTVVAVILVAIAGAAALMPAWRAARADPVSALRAD